METDDNAEMQHEMAMDNLQQALWDEKKPVSYKWLSHHMSIDANTAKRYLHSFATAHPSRVSILYYLSGCRPNDDTHHIEIIPQTLLEQTKTQYKTILSLHIYSLAPVKDGVISSTAETDITPITEAIWASDMESLRQDYADNDVMRDNPLRDNRYGHVEHWGVTRSAKPRLADQPSPAKASLARSDSGAAAAAKKAAAKPSFFGAKSTSSSSTSTSTSASATTTSTTTSTSTSSSRDPAVSSPKASAPVTSSSSPPSSTSSKKKVVAPPKTGTLASMFGQQVQKAKQTSPTKAVPKPAQTEKTISSSSSATSTTTNASSSSSTSTSTSTSISSKPMPTATSKPTPTPSAPTSIFDDDEDDVMAVPDDDGEVEAVFTEVKPVKAEEAAAIKAKQQAKREAEERALKEREAERKKRETDEREAAEKEKERKVTAAAAAAAAATTSPPAKESASKKRKSTSTKAKPASKKKKVKSASSTKKKKNNDDDDDDLFESDAEEASEPEQVEEVVDDVEIEDIDMGDVDGGTRKSTIDAFLTAQAPITTPTHIRRKKIQKTTMDEKGWLITKEVWVDDDGNEIPDEVEQIKPKSVTTPSPKSSDMNKENEDAPNRVDDDDDDSGIVRTKIVQQTSRTVTDSGKKVKGKAVAVKKETYKVMTVEKVASKKKKGNDEKGGKGKEKEKETDKETETDKSSKGGKKEKAAAEPAPKAKSTLLGFFSKK